MADEKFEHIDNIVDIPKKKIVISFGDKLETPQYKLEAEFKSWALNNIKQYEDYLLNYGKIPAETIIDYKDEFNNMWLWIEEENVMVDVVREGSIYIFRAYAPWWSRRWLKNTFSVLKAVMF